MAYESKNSQARGRQLKVQSLALSFSVLGHATPASKTITRDDPSLLALKVEGINQFTNALDADDTTPTMATAVDSTGVFNVLISVGEEIEKVVSALLIKRNGQEVISLSLPASAPADGIVAGGARDKIALNVDSGIDISAANLLDACILVQYIAAQ